MNIKQACILLKLNRSTYYYRTKEKEDDSIIEQLGKLAESHPAYGFWKMYQLLRRHD